MGCLLISQLYLPCRTHNINRIDIKCFAIVYGFLVALLSVTDEAGSRLNNYSTPKLYMQAYEIADDNITDLLTSGQPSEKPAVVESVERGTHVAVCC